MIFFSVNTAGLLVFALLLDAAFGDPNWLWQRVPHPVVIIGRLVQWLEERMNLSSREAIRWLNSSFIFGPSGLSVRQAGIGAIGVAVLLSGAVGLGLHWFFMQHPVGIIAEIVTVSILLAQRSLYDHVARVHVGFREGGIRSAREAVSLIVGRDPETLDQAGICRAAIETTAENFSDGVVAPAFWYLIAGLPGIMIYKAVNTADSMIGHRTPRYEQFGWASARLDDWMNLIPARLSAFFIWIAAFLPEYDPSHAVSASMNDASLHRSPNAGWPEAAMAGALDLALAGPRHYESGPVDDAWMNRDGSRNARPADIRRALALFVAACRVHIGFVALVAVAAFGITLLR
jgi:adenosylcobinamide-phosphate synthase